MRNETQTLSVILTRLQNSASS